MLDEKKVKNLEKKKTDERRKCLIEEIKKIHDLTSKKYKKVY